MVTYTYTPTATELAPVGKIASIDRGWLLAVGSVVFVGTIGGKNSLD